MDGGKLSEVNARTVSRRQNELVGKFKMAEGDLVHNLPPNTNQITRCHLELAYQLILSSRHSPGINLR